MALNKVECSNKVFLTIDLDLESFNKTTALGNLFSQNAASNNIESEEEVLSVPRENPNLDQPVVLSFQGLTNTITTLKDSGYSKVNEEGSIQFVSNNVKKMNFISAVLTALDNINISDETGTVDIINTVQNFKNKYEGYCSDLQMACEYLLEDRAIHQGGEDFHKFIHMASVTFKAIEQLTNLRGSMEFTENGILSDAHHGVKPICDQFRTEINNYSNSGSKYGFKAAACGALISASIAGGVLSGGVAGLSFMTATLASLKVMAAALLTVLGISAAGGAALTAATIALPVTAGLMIGAASGLAIYKGYKYHKYNKLETRLQGLENPPPNNTVDRSGKNTVTNGGEIRGFAFETNTHDGATTPRSTKNNSSSRQEGSAQSRDTDNSNFSQQSASVDEQRLSPTSDSSTDKSPESVRPKHVSRSDWCFITTKLLHMMSSDELGMGLLKTLNEIASDTKRERDDVLESFTLKAIRQLHREQIEKYNKTLSNNSPYKITLLNDDDDVSSLGITERVAIADRLSLLGISFKCCFPKLSNDHNFDELLKRADARESITFMEVLDTLEYPDTQTLFDKMVEMSKNPGLKLNFFDTRSISSRRQGVSQ